MQSNEDRMLPRKHHHIVLPSIRGAALSIRVGSMQVLAGENQDQNSTPGWTSNSDFPSMVRLLSLSLSLSNEEPRDEIPFWLHFPTLFTSSTWRGVRAVSSLKIPLCWLIPLSIKIYFVPSSALPILSFRIIQRWTSWNLLGKISGTPN